MLERIELLESNPDLRDIRTIADRVKSGAIIIFPTDSIYALGCAMDNKKGIDRIIKLTGKKEKQTRMSLICDDIRMASLYTSQIPTHVFRVIKKGVPGPYTFILDSSHQLQKMFKTSKKEIGIRIPDNNILRSLISELSAPLMSTSLNTGDEILPYFIDPYEIEAHYRNDVDILVDGGLGAYEETTVIDCRDGDFEVLREGKGSLDIIP